MNRFIFIRRMPADVILFDFYKQSSTWSLPESTIAPNSKEDSFFQLSVLIHHAHLVSDKT